MPVNHRYLFHCFRYSQRLHSSVSLCRLAGLYIVRSAELVMRHQSTFSEHDIDEIPEEVQSCHKQQSEGYQVIIEYCELSAGEPAYDHEWEISKQPQIQISFYQLPRRSYAAFFRHKSHPADRMSQRRSFRHENLKERQDTEECPAVSLFRCGRIGKSRYQYTQQTENKSI